MNSSRTPSAIPLIVLVVSTSTLVAVMQSVHSSAAKTAVYAVILPLMVVMLAVVERRMHNASSDRE